MSLRDKLHGSVTCLGGAFTAVAGAGFALTQPVGWITAAGAAVSAWGASEANFGWSAFKNGTTPKAPAPQ